MKEGGLTMATGVQVVFDCADPDRLADFWAAALGYEKPAPPPGYSSWQDWAKEHGLPENARSAVEDPDGVGPRIFFQRVPEPKVVKNRVHLDLNVGGGRRLPLEERIRRCDAEAELLAALGATRIRGFEEDGEYTVNMLDPEGNEFDLQ